MKNSYTAIDRVFEHLDEIGVLGPAFTVVITTLLTLAAMLLGVILYRSFKNFRIRGGLSGVRNRKTIKALRARGQLEGEFTYADANELTETGTIRRKTLEDKIVNCIMPIEILFQDIEHGLMYQFEMGEWSEKEVASWVEVTKALNLSDISRIMQEVALMRDAICHPEHDPAFIDRGEAIGERLQNRAYELHDLFVEINGIARLRAACEAHLRRKAPEMLPLPTW